MIFGSVIGRLTADPQIKQGQNSTFVTCSVAVNHGKKDGVDQTTYVDLTANGNTGDLIAKHFKKGNTLAVQAELRMRTYNDKNYLHGNVALVDFNGSQSSQQNQGSAGSTPPAPPSGPTPPSAPSHNNTPPPPPSAPTPPPQPAPQTHTDQAGNLYHLINNQWQLVRPAAPAPAAPQGQFPF